MNFNQKTYVFYFKYICFLFLDFENNKKNKGIDAAVV